MRINRRKISGGILLICLAGASAGYYLFNKGPLNVKNAHAIKTSAVTLYHEYAADSIAAQKKYASGILQVSGMVSKIAGNEQGEMIVLLKTNTDGAFINCTLHEKAPGIKQNDSVEVKGICTGMGQGEPDLGIKGDLYLTRGIVIK
jgi:tRNA_anti-like